MNVLALLTDGFGAGGGIARYNQALMTALGRCPAISRITILPRFGAPSVPLPPRVTQLSPSAGKFSWSARALACGTRERFGAVFCGHLNAAPLGAAIARLARAPLWVQAHGIEAWEPRSTVTRMGLESATMVTSVSRYTRRRLLDWSDVAPERVRVLPNTFAASFSPRRRNHTLAVRLGLAGKRVILTVGRLSATERYKGHDRVIRAMPVVLQAIPDAAYLIVGTGDDRMRLEQLAAEHSLEEVVRFAGAVADAELSDHFSIADLFAMPSTGEGFGIVYLEAAASGLPVIAGNGDGSCDALADGVIGRTVDPDDIAALADAIIAALEGRQETRPEAVARFADANFSRHVDELVRTLVH